MFGVLVCCTGHSKISHLDTIRGMTAYGAYVNEGSLANVPNEAPANIYCGKSTPSLSAILL
ncbi:hypothetical protein ACUN90_30635, partial [Escherichia sp. SP-MK2]